MSIRKSRVPLWGGPEDGAEVTPSPGQVEYFTLGPPKVPNHPGEIRPNGETPVYKGRYEYVSANKRFEWRGYE